MANKAGWRALVVVLACGLGCRAGAAAPARLWPSDCPAGPARARADAALLRQDYDEGIPALLDEAAQHPHCFYALAILTQMMRERGRLSEALAFADRMQQIDPATLSPSDRVEQKIQRGETLMRLGRFDEAERDTQEALRRVPGNFYATWLLCELRWHAGRLADARQAAEQLVALSSTPATISGALAMRATVEGMAGQPEAAEADLRRALKLDPDNREGLRVMSQRLRLEGRPREALPYADREVAWCDSHPGLAQKGVWATAYDERAAVYEALDRVPEAAADFQRALKLSPNPQTLLAALEFFARHRSPAADGVVAQALSACAGRPSAGLPCTADILLAAARSKLNGGPGDWKEAARAFALAARRAPAGSAGASLRFAAQLGLAESYRRLGRGDDAERASREADGQLGAAEQSALAAAELNATDGAKAVEEVAATLGLEASPARTADFCARVLSARTKLGPRDREQLRLRLADALESLGRAREASQAADAAVLEAPGDDQAIVTAARLKLRLGEKEAAANLAKRLQPAPGAPGPEAAVLFLERASLQSQSGDAKAAEASLEAASASALASTEAAHGLAVIRLRRGDAAGALAAASSPSLPSDPSTTALAAIAALLRGDAPAGRRLLSTALAADPKKACLPPLTELDAARLPETFFALCRRALPDAAELAADDGIALYLAGRRSNAEAAFREALRLKPDSLEAALSLAAALEEHGASAEARSVLTAALKAAAPRRSNPAYAAAQDELRRLSSRPR